MAAHVATATSGRYAAAFDLVERWTASGALPTSVLGVATSAGIERIEAFGSRADASGSPLAVEIDDRFAIFSITKVVSGLAAARAIERGLLSLEAPLARVVPTSPPGITLTHLLSHTSGLSEPPLAPPEGLGAALATATADFAPGTASRYSSIAFEGVAAVVSDATGVPFAESLLEVAEAAGDTTMSFEAAGALPVHDTAELGLDYPLLQSQDHPGAGLYATAPDLLALGSSLLRNDGAIVHPTTLAAMRRPLTVGLPRLAPYPAERGQDWGLTFNLRTRAPGLLDRGVFGHGGWSGTELWMYPDRDLCFVLMTNVGSPGRFGVDIDALSNAVASGR